MTLAFRVVITSRVGCENILQHSSILDEIINVLCRRLAFSFSVSSDGSSLIPSVNIEVNEGGNVSKPSLSPQTGYKTGAMDRGGWVLLVLGVLGPESRGGGGKAGR